MSGGDRKQLSVVSDQSKGSKKEAYARSASSKSSAGTLNKCQCKVTKSDISSSKVKAMEQSKGSSDVCSNKSITSNNAQ